MDIYKGVEKSESMCCGLNQVNKLTTKYPTKHLYSAQRVPLTLASEPAQKYAKKSMSTKLWYLVNIKSSLEEVVVRGDTDTH